MSRPRSDSATCPTGHRPSVSDRGRWTAGPLCCALFKSKLSVRSYELATLAAARALRSSYCALAHGSVLADKVFDAPTVAAIVTDALETPLEPGERALMAFAEKVACRADQISSADIEALRSHGYRDEEIFDLAAAAAARCFFSKLLDAVGVRPDSVFNDLDPALRRALTVGRPVDDLPAVKLPGEGTAAPPSGDA
jgi:alkylhydroperoxidase/carboxymuconolactone decarboxylase family protein YurZ